MAGKCVWSTGIGIFHTYTHSLPLTRHEIVCLDSSRYQKRSASQILGGRAQDQCQEWEEKDDLPI